MSDDVDVITETLRARAYSETEELALARVERFVSGHEFASRRRPGLAFELLVAGVVAAVAITGIVALTRPWVPAPHRTPGPIATSSAPTASPTPQMSWQIPPFSVQQVVRLDTPFQATALSVSSGSVWVAASSPVYGHAGRLFRVDAASARQTGSWVVGGDPVAISAAGGFVWVANSFGDGSLVLPDQNTVMQFNATTGSLIHTYRITSPTGLVASGDGALVVSSETANGPTEVHLLTAGRSSLVATAPGNLQGPSLSGESAVAVCGHNVYLGMSELSYAGAQSINIYAVPLGGGPARMVATIQGGWWPAMACDSATLFAFPGNETRPVRLQLTDGSVSTLPGVAGVTAVGLDDGSILDVYNADGPAGYEGYLGALNPSNGVESAQPFPFGGPETGGAFLLGTDGLDDSNPSAWVVVSVPSASAGGDVLVLWHLRVVA
jgi:hypothetical protein